MTPALLTADHAAPAASTELDLPLPGLPLLTPADWEVIYLMALGMSDKISAIVIGAIPQTVKSRISKINRKLGTGNRIGILRAVGWLDPPADAVAIGTQRWLEAQAPPAPKTHCLRGHLLSGDNLYIDREYRRCKACRRLMARRRAACGSR